jgi:AcrR family transcriptional regulator
VTDTVEHAQTRERLLAAGGEVFAEHGFKNATIREICRRAGANVAAVNYYFRDKEELYQEVFRLASHSAMEPRMPTVGKASDPAERIGGFIRGMLHQMLSAGKPAWHGRLMAWEMVEPTSALTQVVEHSIRPTFEELKGMVAELLGPGWGDLELRHAASSVIAQCLFWKHSQPVIQTLYPEMVYTADRIDEIADHVTRFCHAALHGLKAAGPHSSRGGL